MASFDQACPACGYRMRVPERLRERTLRCLTCGVEFVADPETAVEERTAVRRRVIAVVAVTVALAVIAVLLWWLGRPQTGSVLGALPGEIVVAEAPSGEWVPAGATREQARALAGGRTGAETAIRLASGTRLRILGAGDPARVRVLGGSWTGRVVWVGARWLRTVPDEGAGPAR